MKQRILSTLLCLALLVSALSAGMVLPAAAAKATVTDITASSNADKVIAAADNILASATCSDSTLSPTAVPNAYNGVVDDNCWNRKEPYIEGAVGDYMWVTYTLATATDVESVLFGGSGAERSGLGLGFTGVAVYIGDADAAAIQADSSIEPVYETADQICHARRVDFPEAIKGTKIVFRFGIHRHEGWSGNVWISELAAAGFAPFTVTNITASSNTDKVIAAEDNILASATCSDSTLTPAEKPGVYNGVVDDNCWNRKEPYIEGAVGDYMWVTYTLATATDVESVLFGGSGAERSGLGLGFTGAAVYIGDADAATIQADSSIEPVYETADQICHARRVDFGKSVKGTKIVFRFGIHRHEGWSGNVWISELAATGYAPFTVTTITTANATSPIAAEDNLLATAAVTEPYMVDAEKLFNGVINEAGNTWDVQSKYLNKVVDGYMWVTFTLTEAADIDELVISGACETGASGPLGFDGVDVYIGDLDHEAILADDSVEPVYSYHAFMRETLHVEFGKAITGTKVVFKMGIMGTLKTDSYKDRIRLSELAAKVFSDEPDEPEEPEEPKELPVSSTLDVSSMQNTSKVIPAASNLLPSATCSDSTLTPAEKPGVYNGVVDDNVWNRKVPYIEGADGNDMWVTYTLAEETELGSFLVAGSGAERNGLGLGFTGFAIYVGNRDAAAIKADKNACPVYETDDQIRYGRRVDLKEPAKGTKVVFRFGIHQDANWAGNVWISELSAAAYDPDAYTPPTEALIANKLADVAYLSWPRTAGVKMEKSQLDVSTLAFATDGNMTTLYNPRFVGDATKYVDGYATMYAAQSGGVLDPNYAWITLIYYLGGEAELQSVNLKSSNEPGYYIAGVDMYASNSYADLFAEENCIYTTNGGNLIENENGKLLLDPACDKPQAVHSADMSGTGKTARYVAFTITRPYGSTVRGWFIPRLAELEVNGWMRNPEDPFDTTKQTVTDEATGITATLSREDLDDVAFFDGLQLKVTVTDLPSTVEKNIENKWLTVDSKVYTLALTDKDGKVITDEEMGDRYWKLSFPTDAGYLQTLAFLKDGQLEHFRNSRTDASGKTIIAGNEWRENDATLYGNSHQLVIMKYNDLETIHKLHGDTMKGIQVYVTEGVAAVTETTGLPLWAWLSLLSVAVAATATLLVLRRRRSRS